MQEGCPDRDAVTRRETAAACGGRAPGRPTSVTARGRRDGNRESLAASPRARPASSMRARLRADAAVDAEAEGGVAVDLAVDDDLVGVARSARGPGWRPGTESRTSRRPSSGSRRTRCRSPRGGPWSPARRPAGAPRSPSGMSSGSATRRSRSAGVLARCQIEAPMALHVVSMPAIRSSAACRARGGRSAARPSSSACEQVADEVVAGVVATWSSIWACR